MQPPKNEYFSYLEHIEVKKLMRELGFDETDEDVEKAFRFVYLGMLFSQARQGITLIRSKLANDRYEGTDG